jgi:diguanylate cyclase (GGDEF)-like protein/PAS domain S-box-containing protein
MDDPRTREDLERQIALLERRFEELREFLPDALVEGRLPAGPVTYFNRMALVLFGYPPEEVRAGVPAPDLFAAGEFPRVQELVARYVGESLASRTPYARSGRQDLYEVRLRRKDGSEFVAECQSSFLLDAQGIPVGIRTLVRDITERKRLEGRLEELSYRDPLTGCYNRRHLQKERPRLERPTARWACLVFDLDHFKAVNDTHGHEEGDRVLRGFAHFVRRQHRPDDLLVRTGGDEFALIARADSDAEAEAIARRLREAAVVDSPAAFSMGLAFRRSGESLADVLARADRSMYATRAARPPES